MGEMEAESLLADLEAQIARDEAEGIVEEDNVSTEEYEQFCTEMELILAQGEGEIKAAWFAQQRKRRRRRR